MTRNGTPQSKSALACLVVFLILAAGSGSLAAQEPFLEAVQTILDGAGGTQGLDGARSIVVSPDGQDVYTAAPIDDSLVHWRLAANGTLSQVKIYRGGFEGLEALDTVHDLGLSSDGLHLYAITEKSALLVFRRAAGTGALALVQAFSGEASGFLSLELLSNLELAPDGAYLYILNADSGFSPVLSVFSRNATDGRLTFLREFVDLRLDDIQSTPILRFAADMAFSQNGEHLYIASLAGLALLDVNPATGEVTVVDGTTNDDGISAAGAVAVGQDGQQVFASNLTGETGGPNRGVWALDRDATTGLLSLVAECCEGLPGDPPFFDWPSLSIASNGRDFYLTAIKGSKLLHLRWNGTAKTLTVAGTYENDPQGSPGYFGAAATALAPDGSKLYLLSSDDKALHVFDRNATTGALTPRQALRDGAGAQIRGARFVNDAIFTPDGRFLYTAASVDDLLGIYQVNAAAGTIQAIDAVPQTPPSEPSGSFQPIDFAISPDGRFLFTLSSLQPRVYAIDTATGGLTLVQQLDRIPQIQFLQLEISADGRTLYARGFNEVLTLSADLSTGHLDVLQVFDQIRHGGSPDSLNPSDLAVSGDGQFLYVTEPGQDLLIFDRNPDAGGELTLRSQLTGNFAAGMSFRNLREIEVSADGRNLYALFFGSQNGSLVAFERDRETGALTFLETHPMLAAGVEEPAEAGSLRLAADGHHLYFRDQHSEALVVFDRNRRTGTLARREERRNGDGLDGFLNPRAVALSPDSAMVVVSTDAGLQVFRAGAPECPTDGQGLCLQDDRFAVTVDWERRNGATGIAQSVPFGSDDSGLLWFFAEDNWEMLVKVLDGCANNGHYWVFSAATTNVEYTLNVADRETGQRRSYTNPQGTSAAALTDTRAFATCPTPAAGSGAAVALEEPAPSIFPLPEPRSITPAFRGGIGGGCVASDIALCLNDGRFKVEVAWERPNGITGVGHAVPFGSDDSGLLWFFNEANWEMLIKVLDGCANNGHYWVFSAATTNVEYALRVTDTATGTIQEYVNLQGNRAAAITDTRAFATCN